ncbi:MAG TPA: hypothetical protein VMS64_13785 [Candidatus Methylomirabilis sp.]|nr:hypothetical protein [Candidatus Methylomirabilis sp.]
MPPTKLAHAVFQTNRMRMLWPAFAEKPISVAYDPDALMQEFRSGVPVAELVVRD